MKRVGLLGGTSWESSLEYYRQVNSKSNAMLGGLHTLSTVLYSLDFGEVRMLADSGRDAELQSLWGNAAQTLLDAGAEVVAICSNAGHKRSEVIATVLAQRAVPLVHIVDATLRPLCIDGAMPGKHVVGVLGTFDTTRAEGFYAEYLARVWATKTVFQAEPERREIHRIIFDEVVHGQLTAESRRFARAAIDELMDRGATAVALACTELPLLLAGEKFDIPVLDTLSLHVDEILRVALRGDIGAGDE